MKLRSFLLNIVITGINLYFHGIRETKYLTFMNKMIKLFMRYIHDLCQINI